MEYNTLREPLIIPEYGRHVQKMVDHCMTLEDEEERNGFAHIIIEVMGSLNPHLRDIPDFQHKLWDQLFLMSNFKLDVKSPYPIPTREEAERPPDTVPYPQSDFKYKYYGKNIRKMIDVALTWEGDKQEGLIMVIANHMKKCYLLWNKGTVDDNTIFAHLKELSDGEIDLLVADESLLSPERLQIKAPQSSNKKPKRTKRKK